MKNAVKVCAFFLLLVTGGLHAQQLSLDEAIKRAARGIEEILPQRAKVAVLNFVSPAEAFSDYVVEELTGELVTGRKITIVDRRNLALISQEMHLQLSGDVSDESAQAIGRMLGAQSIVSGTLTNMGSFHRFRIRVINVETAAIQTQVSLDLQNNAQVAFLLGGTPTAASSVPAPAVSGQAAVPAIAPTSAAYKVGDRGPAGGLVFYSTEPRTSFVPPPITGTFTVGAAGPAGGVVFYSTEPRTSFVPPPVNGTFDVGRNGPAGGVVFYPVVMTTSVQKAPDRDYQIGDTGPAGGIIFLINPVSGNWKYMEAAPANTEKVTFWASENFPTKDINNMRAVGTGKSNASYIMRMAVDRGGGFDWAAEVCDSLAVNGYSDWFLPSRDELHQMYGNLHRRGLGGFKAENYWSSTAGSDNGEGAWIQNFTDGSQNGDLHWREPTVRAYRNRVRAIRQF